MREEALRNKYYRKNIKKQEGKPSPLQTIMERSFSSGIHIRTSLADIPFEKLTREIYFFSRDIQQKEFSRLYDAQLEFAGIEEEKFIFGLHGFYNSLTTMVKKENKYAELFAFIGAVMRMRDEKQGIVSTIIINSYLDLTLQTMEYLRSNKFALDTCVYGLKSDGTIITDAYPYAYSDYPSIEIQKRLYEGKPYPTREEIFALYRKAGINLTSASDLSIFEQIQRIHINSVCTLLPYINEETLDMAPVKPYESMNVPLRDFTCENYTLSELQSLLSNNPPQIPASGLRFLFQDRTGELKAMKLRGVEGKGVILYKLETSYGNLYGYLEPQSGYISSALKETTIPGCFERFALLLLALCLTQSLAPTHPPILCQRGLPILVEVLSQNPRIVHSQEKVPSRRYTGDGKPAISNLRATISTAKTLIANPAVAARFSFRIESSKI